MQSLAISASRFILDIWAVLAEMSPFLLLGFLIAGVLHVLIPASTVQRHLGRGGIWPVIKAALIGVPLPLCSCGVIPLAAAMRRQGASRAATVSFLLSTPQTGVDSILVTYSLLGPLLAVYRPVMALLTGIIGGGAIEALARGDDAPARPAPLPAKKCSCCDESCPVCEAARAVLAQAAAPAPACSDSCCDSGAAAPAAKTPHPLRRILHYGFVTLPRDLGKPLLLGMLAAAAITAAIPPGFFTPYLGGGIWAMLAMMAIGIPMYVCSTSSVPIAAALIAAGVSPGAAFVFLVTGPVTNAAEIAALWSLLGKRTVAVYLGAVIACSLAGGFALDALLAAAGLRINPVQASPLGEEVSALGAIVLLLVMANALWPRRPRGPAKEIAMDTERNQTMNLAVSGMSCNGCVNAVTRALKLLPGVEQVEVDLASGSAHVTGAGLDLAAMVAAIERIGFKASLA